MALVPLISQRRSLRAIDPNKQISDTVLESLLEAARWAPSSGNAQPWRFIPVRERSALAKVREALKPGNRTWADRAPMLMVIGANPEDDSTTDEKEYYLFDCGLAAENMILQGIAEGLIMHPMLGWTEQLIKQALNVPDPIRIAVVIAVGYPGRLEDLNEKLQKKETADRKRKPLAEITHYDGWQNTS